MTFNLGLQLEATGGTTDGQDILLAMIDQQLQLIEGARQLGPQEQQSLVA